MCGIFGLFTDLDFVTKSLLSGISRTFAHRGPDDSGCYSDFDAGIYLLHQRLSIIDTSRNGHQPMISSDSKVVLIFNGEIYNFIDIRRMLLRNGCIFRGESDTEVLLSYYIYCRDNGVPISTFASSLNGVFSFIVCDLASKISYIIRDRFGVKPLYMLSFDRLFAFASEIKPLVYFLHNSPLDCDISASIDCSALEKYSTFLWCPGSQTPSKLISCVSPGSLLTLDNSLSFFSDNFYCFPSTLPADNLSSFKSRVSADTLISVLREKIKTSVERQMVSDVPLGSFLSGGLDSSTIVHYASKINPHIRCFTIDTSSSSSSSSSNDGFSDDLPYARRVARHLGVPLDVVKVDPSTMAQSLEKMVWQLDEPLADPAPLNLFFICRLARDNGIKVLLSGAAGDDLFTGYRRHLALNTERLWRWLPQSALTKLKNYSGNLPVNMPLLRRCRKALSGADLEGDERLVHYFRWIDRSDLHALYSPAFRAALVDERAEDPMIEFLNLLPNNLTPLEQMLALEQRFFLADHNLTYTDKMSMAAGVEVRVPFLDNDLVDFAASIPTRYKQKCFQSKWILKKAMEPYLPREVVYRPKSGFGAPLRRWLRFELHEWLTDILSPSRLARRGLFDSQAVHKMIEDNSSGRIDASYTLLSLACIEIWCTYFIDYTSNSLVDPR